MQRSGVGWDNVRPEPLDWTNAASLERPVDTADDLDAAVPIVGQRAKRISLIVAAICSDLVIGALAISYSKAGTEPDDDRTEIEAPDKPGDDSMDEDSMDDSEGTTHERGDGR